MACIYKYQFYEKANTKFKRMGMCDGGGCYCGSGDFILCKK